MENNKPKPPFLCKFKSVNIGLLWHLKFPKYDFSSDVTSPADERNPTLKVARFSVHVKSNTNYVLLLYTVPGTIVGYVYVYGVQEFLIFTLSRSRVLNGGNQGKVK